MSARTTPPFAARLRNTIKDWTRVKTGLPAPDAKAESHGLLLEAGGVRLGVAPGEFVTLLGGPASGKSRLLQLVSGARRLGDGRLSHDGAALGRTPMQLRGFGILAQDYVLFPRLTLAQNIAYPLARRGIGRRRRKPLVDAALEAISLADASRLPHQASPAERQRACIARATVFGPTVLLLDEPLAHQSPAERAALRAALRRLHLLLGASTIMATRTSGDAMAVSDRVVVLDRGETVQSGTPALLYDQPHSAVAALACGEGEPAARHRPRHR